jgi:uncharacterized tellurite resistance protein B-like protein
LRASTRPSTFNYRPASGTLLRMASQHGALKITGVPNVTAISSQFKPLIVLWQECIEELQAFHRAAKTGETGPLSTEAYEALPYELRDGDHPEHEAWMQLWSRFADADGWPLIPVGEVARLKGIDQRGRLTKTQCNRILKTADAMGIGMEPDTRLTGRYYRWTEIVSPFFLETDAAEDMASYNAASVLLRLGVTVVEADGQVDANGLAYLATNLEHHFNLSPNQSKRLAQLRYLILHAIDADKTVSTAMLDKLSAEERSLVGKFLVGIAAADQVITPREVRALRAAYRTLRLAPETLDDLLAPYRVAQKAEQPGEAMVSAGDEFRLDMDAVATIMQETREVSEILSRAMKAEEDFTDEDKTSSASAQPAGPEVVLHKTRATAEAGTAETAGISNGSASRGERFPELAERFQPFLEAALRQKQWPVGEITDLARQHQLMLAGAMEAINEWSYEKYEDWLMEEGDPVIIHSELLQRV